MELGLRVGLLSLQLFPNGGATDIIFVTVLQLRGTVVTAPWTLPEHFVVLAAVHGSLGLSGWCLSRGFTLLPPFSHSSPSLIGLLASVDVKQQCSFIPR